MLSNLPNRSAAFSLSHISFPESMSVEIFVTLTETNRVFGGNYFQKLSDGQYLCLQDGKQEMQFKK